MSILILLYQPTYSVPCHYKKYKKKDVLKLFVFFFCVWYSIPYLNISLLYRECTKVPKSFIPTSLFIQKYHHLVESQFAKTFFV